MHDTVTLFIVVQYNFVKITIMSWFRNRGTIRFVRSGDVMWTHSNGESRGFMDGSETWDYTGSGSCSSPM